MFSLITEIALVIGAYLLGAFPYMPLLCQAKGFHIPLGKDTHLYVWRKIGRIAGLSGVFVDIIKGFLPIFIGFLLDFRLVSIVIAGVAATIGQMWPVFRKFNGDKGNTTGGGMALALTIFLGNGALLALYGGITFFILGFLIRTTPRFIARGQTVGEKFKLGGPTSNSLPVCMLAGFAVMSLISCLSSQPLELTLALTTVFIAIVIRRLTANIGEDLKAPKTSLDKILLNRFLFDRSYF